MEPVLTNSEVKGILEAVRNRIVNLRCSGTNAGLNYYTNEIFRAFQLELIQYERKE